MTHGQKNIKLTHKYLKHYWQIYVPRNFTQIRYKSGKQVRKFPYVP